MSDVMRVAADVETPVNPYSLLEAVNNASDTAHTAWLIFLALMTYLMVAVAGVTHKALLLETPVALPLLQVQIPITQFFEFAPVILLLLHIGVVSQLVLLARKTIEFDQAIRLLESTDRRTHPLRLELSNFFFVQAVAGPHRSMVMSAFLHAMSWLTLVILPVVLILYVQVVFLPYHDIGITWAHRVALLTDIAMLLLIGVFLIRAESSFLHAFVRTSTQHPLSFLATGVVLVLVALFSLFVATVPGERMDRLARSIAPRVAVQVSSRDPRQSASFTVPFFKSRTDGSWLGFHRNLVVTDTDLVVDKEVTNDEPSLNLRGRDLRYARLDRSDLHQADLTGADLSDASLVGTDLRNVSMNCDSDILLRTEDRAAARCVSARRADFSKARLQGARLTGIDFRQAKLEEAQLEAADASFALLAGANFTAAHLGKAELTGGVQAQGASFLLADLQGADLNGAQLQGADLSTAQLQGAILRHANLSGASLRDADLEGGDLYYAKLHGADMSGARTRAVDLRGAAIWMTQPPAQDATALSDVADVAIKPLDEIDTADLKRTIEQLTPGPLRLQVAAALASVTTPEKVRAWAGTPEQLRWDSMARVAVGAVGDGYKSQLTEHLGRMMCRARWGSGAVATGVARRAQTQEFRGDLLLIQDRARAADCPVAQRMHGRVLRDLNQAADVARSN